ncbi:MAG TPA: hypothetical protein VLN56_09570 [Gammaproteobacteria bacterium]|nr:hypothetical protein [Gammaproteobacteria bacterium]
MKKILPVLIVALIAFYWFTKSGDAILLEDIPPLSIDYENGLSIDNPPLQKKLERSTGLITSSIYWIKPVAELQARARILGIKYYRLDRESDLSPVDIAMGWGPMAKDSVLEKLNITQSNRFYYWRTNEFPIPRREIEKNSANMHFIPANPEVVRKLKELEEDDIIQFKGYLVRVDARDGWQWNSSMSRSDTGRGACELVLVDDITRL